MTYIKTQHLRMAKLKPQFLHTLTTTSPDSLSLLREQIFTLMIRQSIKGLAVSILADYPSINCEP